MVDTTNSILLPVLFSLGLLLTLRVGSWILRIRRLKRSILVIAVLVPPSSIFRIFFLNRWQTFHRDWHNHSGRKILQTARL